jgi:hypothetical protein
MNSSLRFRQRLTLEEEILARSATFLPVEFGRARTRKEIYRPKMRNLAGFSQVANFCREKIAVAQPLLKEACDEMR